MFIWNGSSSSQFPNGTILIPDVFPGAIKIEYKLQEFVKPSGGTGQFPFGGLGIPGIDRIRLTTGHRWHLTDRLEAAVRSLR